MQEQVQQKPYRCQMHHHQNCYESAQAVQRMGCVLVLNQVEAAVQQLLVRVAGVVLAKATIMAAEVLAACLCWLCCCVVPASTPA